LDPAAYLATSGQGGGGGNTLLYSNLKVIAVPVLATILNTAPLSIFLSISESLNLFEKQAIHDQNKSYNI